MKPEDVDKLIRYLTPAERAELDAILLADLPDVDFFDPLFPEQTAFLRDTSPLRVVLCTRRSGKSYAAGLALCDAAWNTPNVSCLYVALTRNSAKRIMWKDVLKAINHGKKLGAKFNETELSMTFPNGSIIYLLGLDADESEKEKALGQKFKSVVVDEAASYTVDLHEMVYGILKPAVADYRGQISLIGTPGNLKRGLYYDLTSGEDPQQPGRWQRLGWSGHRWSAFNNPHMREQWLSEIDDLKTANPRVVETPLFQQHYLGRWVVDDTALVYKFARERNLYAGPLPPTLRGGRWRYVMGIDLGHSPDPTAWVVCAYHDNDRRLYVVEVDKKLGQDITDVATRTRELMSRYDFDRIVIDNANKQAVEEMKRRHGLPLLPADKTGKADFVELMNGELLQGNIKVEANGARALIEEWENLVWDERSSERREHPGCANHLSDAALYAWRNCYQYLATPPKPVIESGTREAMLLDERNMLEAEQQRLEAEITERQMREAVENDWGW